MCLMVFAYRIHPRYRLILGANRDEYHDRPTVPARFWPEVPQLLAGRDLVHGGTWLGVTLQGRLGALTNYREPHDESRGARSRGTLVSSFLTSGVSAERYLEKVQREGGEYHGFNLLLGERGSLCYCSNRKDAPLRLEPGLYGLSNHLLDTPWPKVLRAKELLARMLEQGTVSSDQLFAILADTLQAPDDQLPHTGLAPEREKLLSSIFVTRPRYGTRSSTVLLIDDREGTIYRERTFGADGPGAVVRDLSYTLPGDIFLF